MGEGARAGPAPRGRCDPEDRAAGQSDYWRPFLEALAAKPDEWVSWHELCAEIGLDPKKASGMLGAAERRCKGLPPYYKSGYTEGDHWFSMPPEVADMIKEFAAE